MASLNLELTPKMQEKLDARARLAGLCPSRCIAEGLCKAFENGVGLFCDVLVVL